MKTIATYNKRKTNACLVTLLLFVFMLLGCMTAGAQIKITFEEGADDYKSISVYDPWEDSPFMTGRLTGNVKVIDNHLNKTEPLLGYAPNESHKIVGFQRSRYGSNCYGVRIDLKKPFRLTRQAKYVHVMINRPLDDGKCMLFALGKRTERKAQSAEVIQVRSESNAVGKNQWNDVVFLISGFSEESDKSPDVGIDIYSLVVIPDLTDRSSMAEDFACYIDEIEVSSDLAPRFINVEYMKNVEDDEPQVRFDTPLYAVTLNHDNSIQPIDITTSYVYEKHYEKLLNVAPGDVVKPDFIAESKTVQGYVYVDWGRDGVYSYDVDADSKPTVQSDLVSYDGYVHNGHWVKSDGTSSMGYISTGSMPSFHIPDNANGIYPIRFKLDGNNLNPAGNATWPTIADYGGRMIDALLNVHGKECTINSGQLNGDFFSPDGTILNNYKVPFGQTVTIKVVPAPGFTHDGCKVRYGYNLSGDSLLHGVPQYFEQRFSYSQFEGGEYLTLPSYILSVDNVEIEGYMIDKDPTSSVYVEKEMSSEEFESVRNSGSYHVSGAKANDSNVSKNGIMIKAGKKYLRRGDL